MKFSPFLLAALAAALFSVSAGAQLKAPRDAQAPARAAAASAPAAKPAAETKAHAEKESAGVLAAAGWLVLLDRRDWGRAWETASTVFQGAVPLPAWMEGIPKVREPLGALIERQPTESVYKTTLEGRPEGDYVSVIFLSKFEKIERQEMITIAREADGKWRVTGYSLR